MKTRLQVELAVGRSRVGENMSLYYRGEGTFWCVGNIAVGWARSRRKAALALRVPEMIEMAQDNPNDLPLQAKNIDLRKAWSKASA